MALTVHPDSAQQGVPEKVKEAQNAEKNAAAITKEMKERKLSFNSSDWKKQGVDFDGTLYPYNFDIPSEQYFELARFAETDLPLKEKAELMDKAFDICTNMPEEVKALFPPGARSEVVLDWMVKSSRLSEDNVRPLGKTG